MAIHVVLTCDKCGKEIYKKDLMEDEDRCLDVEDISSIAYGDDVDTALEEYADTQVLILEKFVGNFCKECIENMNTILFRDGTAMPIPNENDNWPSKEAINDLKESMDTDFNGR